MEFGKPERGSVPKKLSTEEVLDSQIGLLEWEMEEREKQHNVEHLTRLQTRKAFDTELRLRCGEIEEKRKRGEKKQKEFFFFFFFFHFLKKKIKS